MKIVNIYNYLDLRLWGTTGKKEIHKCNKNINNHPLDIIASVVKRKKILEMCDTTVKRKAHKSHVYAGIIFLSLSCCHLAPSGLEIS